STSASMRASLSRNDFTSLMMSSLSFLYLRSCEGVRAPLWSLSAMSWSCRRRSRLYSLAMLSKVSTTWGLSSASMAASESEFSISSSSKSPSPGAGSPPSPSSPLARSGAPLNGVAPAGAAGGAGVCASTGGPGTGGAPGGATIGWPAGPITGAGMGLASGPAEGAPRAMMLRSKTLPSLTSADPRMMAWKVSGLSHRPAIIASRPASMRLAMAISPSRDRSLTGPISRRYMRTGSSVRPLRVSVREDPTHSTLVLIDQAFALHGFALKDIESSGGRLILCGGPSDVRRLGPLGRGEIDAVFDEGIKVWLDEALAAGLSPIELEPTEFDAMGRLGWRKVSLPKARFPRLARDTDTLD